MHTDRENAMEATVAERGQITLPKAVRDALGLTKGTMDLVDEPRMAEVYAAMGPGTEVSGGSAANTIVGVASDVAYGSALWDGTGETF